MCGRYTLKSSIEEISEIIRGKFNYPDISSSYNIAPSQKSLIVTYGDEVFQGELAKWGLLPHWLKKKRSPFINARSETVFVKPSFKYLYKNNRCVAVADGFYEWGIVDDGKKQPVYFHLEQNKPFAFAGYWENEQKTDDKTEDKTFLIMTTDANEIVEPFHDRMPVILDQDGIGSWLEDGDKSVLVPYTGELKHHFVSTFVNSPKNNTKQCIIPYASTD